MEYAKRMKWVINPFIVKIYNLLKFVLLTFAPTQFVSLYFLSMAELNLRISKKINEFLFRFKCSPYIKVIY